MNRSILFLLSLINVSHRGLYVCMCKGVRTGDTMEVSLSSSSLISSLPPFISKIHSSVSPSIHFHVNPKPQLLSAFPTFQPEGNWKRRIRFQFRNLSSLQFLLKSLDIRLDELGVA
jgi:hypothetical protein